MWILSIGVIFPLYAQQKETAKIKRIVTTKINLTDIIFMGRITPELEFAPLKNTSITANIGIQYKDFFYDKLDGTFTNFDQFFQGIVNIFPSKNVFGWNYGLGIRQYLPNKSFKNNRFYVEVKGYLRKTTFKENFEVSYNLGSGNGGAQGGFVSGKQKVKNLYFSLGQTFWYKRFGVDGSIGFTKNFVDLDTCQDGCQVPSYLSQLVEMDGCYHDPWVTQVVGDYAPRESFIKFRMEVKLIFKIF